jgi:hypothetical protein
MSTLYTLRTSALAKSENLSSTYIPTSSIPLGSTTAFNQQNYDINASLQSLYDMLVCEYEKYNRTWLSFTLAGSSTVNVIGGDVFQVGPNIVYKLSGLERTLPPSTQPWVIHPYQFGERGAYTYDDHSSIYIPNRVAYEWAAPLLTIKPAQSAQWTYTMYYTPQLPPLVNDTDTPDAYFANMPSWSEWVSLDCAIKWLSQEETDTSAYERQRDKIEDRIMKALSNSDEGNPIKVVDIYKARDNGYWPGGRW